ncbi:hypothetical protein Cgig2_023636 [Carnegiea gigantea]|uniref:Uncharacterized protein n=1 Tax=Carnegiea gigantea TaxID=171969 RepID=A0A9Q1QIF3_9CARY|nr:hypothetical protein Cgig2_023636 [Carnegiea gigantea]
MLNFDSAECKTEDFEIILPASVSSRDLRCTITFQFKTDTMMVVAQAQTRPAAVALFRTQGFYSNEDLLISLQKDYTQPRRAHDYTKSMPRRPCEIWHYHRAKKAQLQPEIGFINRTIDPDILILTETMVNEQNTQRIIRTLGYRHFDFVLPHNHTAGVWLLWKDDNVVVNVLAKDHRAIHYSILEKGTNNQCIIAAVYAPAQTHEKNDFWHHLMSLNDIFHIPWSVLGNFNEMLHVSKKIGGVPLSASKLYRLNNFLSTCKALDTNVQGRDFTWKKFIYGQLIHEKLDRVIVQEDCLQLFSNYCVTNGPFTCSGHSYVYLDTEPIHLPRKGTTFRYQHS